MYNLKKILHHYTNQQNNHQNIFFLWKIKQAINVYWKPITPRLKQESLFILQQFFVGSSYKVMKFFSFIKFANEVNWLFYNHINNIFTINLTNIIEVYKSKPKIFFFTLTLKKVKKSEAIWFAAHTFLVFFITEFYIKYQCP